MFSAKVIADSVGPHDVRATTIQATYPRFIHSEVLTHRDRARNSASSRAIPWKAKAKDRLTIAEISKIGGMLTGEADALGTYEYYIPKCMYSMIMRNPVIPLSFDVEQRGMQSGESVAKQDECVLQWIAGRNAAVRCADELASMGVHKSLVNRVVEPWMWITVVMTATTWDNFFKLRIHPAAEKHFNHVAVMIRDAINASKPRLLGVDEWHLPFVDDSERYLSIYDLKRISAGRCARVSYLTHDGRRDLSADIALAERLINPGDGVMHASPFEHQLQCLSYGTVSIGCFKGWRSFRWKLENETWTERYHKQ